MKIPYFGLYAKPSSRGQALPLAPTKADGPIVTKFRENVELLSHPSSSLSFFFPPILLSIRFTPTCSSGMSPPCHMSPLHWLSWISPYPLIQFFGFPSSQVVTHVPHGPHLDFCLTCSPFDTWLHIIHLICAKCHSLL